MEFETFRGFCSVLPRMRARRYSGAIGAWIKNIGEGEGEGEPLQDALVDGTGEGEAGGT